MLRKADALVSFPGQDFSAEYTIVRDVPQVGRNTTVCVIFRRDSEKKYTIVIKAPEINKGQGYLKVGDTIWFYDPESRKFNTTSSRERFQNSIASNADFTQSTLAEDYEVTGGEKVKLEAFDCWLLDLKAKTTAVTYPYMKIWVSDEGLVRKMENYSLSKQLLRTIAVVGYRRLGQKYVPQSIRIQDELKGAMVESKMVHENVLITITKPSLVKRPDSVYSKAFLESLNP